MDVFKLQKINNLASDLKRHNFASSSEEAFQQAEQVFVEPESKPVEESGSVVVQKVDLLAEKKFELILEQNNKKYEQEIGLLRSALNTLAQELECLKSEFRKLSEHAPPKPKERQEPLKTETKEEHPRQGKFQPGDVDIQKMFYFGTKH